MLVTRNISYAQESCLSDESAPRKKQPLPYPDPPKYYASDLIDSEGILTELENINRNLVFEEIGEQIKAVGNELETGNCLRLNGNTFGKEFIDFGNKLIEFSEEVKGLAEGYKTAVTAERREEDEDLTRYNNELSAYYNSL